MKAWHKVILAGLVVAAIVLAVYHPASGLVGKDPPPSPSPNGSTTATVVKVEYSPQPVSAPIYAYPYFEARDYIQVTNSSGAVVDSYWTIWYPVTPGMVGWDWLRHNGTSSYPDYIVQYYQQNYPEFFDPSYWATNSPQGLSLLNVVLVQPGAFPTWDSVMPRR